MKEFKGKVLFLDRSDINTDEIIPARYLTEITKIALKPYLLEDLTLDQFNPNQDINEKGVIITRANFGCGSSREHAPWALEVNNINVIIASSFARIFRQNIFNCGMCAIELSEAQIEHLFSKYSNKDTFLAVNVTDQIIEIEADGEKETIGLSISEYDNALVKAGGWVEYADKNY